MLPLALIFYLYKFTKSSVVTMPCLERLKPQFIKIICIKEQINTNSSDVHVNRAYNLLIFQCLYFWQCISKNGSTFLKLCYIMLILYTCVLCELQDWKVWILSVVLLQIYEYRIDQSTNAIVQSCVVERTTVKGNT